LPDRKNRRIRESGEEGEDEREERIEEKEIRIREGHTEKLKFSSFKINTETNIEGHYKKTRRG
jgi:hypothetical protein